MSNEKCLDTVLENKLVDLTRQGKCNEVLSIIKDIPPRKLRMRDGNHLLHIAAMYNNIEVIKNLPIDKGFQLTVMNSTAYTPLIMSIVHGNYEIAKYLYSEQENFPDPNFSRYLNELNLLGWLNETRMSPAKIGIAMAKITKCQLRDIVILHNSIVTEYFLQTVTEMGTYTYFNGAIEIVAEKHDWLHLQVILRYVSKSENVKWFCIFWTCILINICYTHKSKSGKIFLKNIFRSHIFGKGSLQSLEVVLMTVEMKHLKIFLQYNFPAIVKANHGLDILACFCGNPFVNLKSLLSTNQININGRGFAGKTPLHFAAEKGLFDNVKLLLERGADPNALDEKKRTPLALALINTEYKKCVKILLMSDANPLLINEEIDLPEPFLQYFVAQILIYEAMGQSMEIYENLLTSSYEENIDEFMENCRQQLNELKSNRILNTEMTMFTIIAEKPEKLARNVKEAHLESILTFAKYFETVFIPYYIELLNKRCEDISLMQSCRKRAIKTVCQIMGIENPYHLVVNKIVDYLDTNDLRKFVRTESDQSSQYLSLVKKGMRFLKLAKEMNPFKF